MPNNLLLSSSANGQSLDVCLDDGLAFAAENSANGILKLVVLDAQCFLGSTQKNDVSTTGHTIILGSLFDIQHNHIVNLLEIGFDCLDIRIVGDIHERRARRDNPAILRKERQITKCLHRFHRDNNISTSKRNQVTGNRIAGETKVRLYVTTTLRLVAIERIP